MTDAPRRTRTGLAALFAVAALTLGSTAAWADASKVVATIDGAPVTEAELTAAMEDFERSLQRVPDDQRKAVTLQRLIDMRILAAKAAKDGLDKSPDFQTRLAMVRNQLLTNEFVKLKVEGSVTDAELEARYQKEIAGFDPPEEVRARHILVKTEDEAKAVLADLAKGGDFAKIAGEKSQDPGSKDNGGDLGFFAKGQMVPEFEAAAFGLKPGETSKEAVKTQFGFHIIRTEEKRKQQPPAFADVKDQVREVVVGEKFRTMLEDLKKASKVEIVDKSLEAKPQ
jgi:peptidyl-prolyl cis-trans isomerase C